MQTGRIEANLLVLNEEYKLPYVPELVARKQAGTEKCTLGAAEIEFHKSEYTRLLAQLETESANSQLPNEPSCRDALNDLLVRIRLRMPSL